MSETEAAIGILRIMRSNMANGIRLLSIKRGHDPRLFSLVAFGGAGPCTRSSSRARSAFRRSSFPIIPAAARRSGTSMSKSGMILCVRCSKQARATT